MLGISFFDLNPLDTCYSATATLSKWIWGRRGPVPFDFRYSLVATIQHTNQPEFYLLFEKVRIMARKDYDQPFALAQHKAGIAGLGSMRLPS
eukprot:jgi/Botrbrau1/4844/Bobra.0032s0005.1